MYIRFTLRFWQRCMIAWLAYLCLIDVSVADEISELRQQKIAVAKIWWREANVNMAGEFSYDGAFKASLALKDAEWECATTGAERLAVLRSHSDRMQGLFALIKKLYVVGGAGGSATELAEVEYLLLQSKIWIKEEQMRQDGTKRK